MLGADLAPGGAGGVDDVFQGAVAALYALEKNVYFFLEFLLALRRKVGEPFRVGPGGAVRGRTGGQEALFSGGLGDRRAGLEQRLVQLAGGVLLGDIVHLGAFAPLQGHRLQEGQVLSGGGVKAGPVGVFFLFGLRGFGFAAGRVSGLVARFVSCPGARAAGVRAGTGGSAGAGAGPAAGAAGIGGNLLRLRGFGNRAGSCRGRRGRAAGHLGIVAALGAGPGVLTGAVQGAGVFPAGHAGQGAAFFAFHAGRSEAAAGKLARALQPLPGPGAARQRGVQLFPGRGLAQRAAENGTAGIFAAAETLLLPLLRGRGGGTLRRPAGRRTFRAPGGGAGAGAAPRRSGAAPRGGRGGVGSAGAAAVILLVKFFERVLFPGRAVALLVVDGGAGGGLIVAPRRWPVLRPGEKPAGEIPGLRGHNGAAALEIAREGGLLRLRRPAEGEAVLYPVGLPGADPDMHDRKEAAQRHDEHAENDQVRGFGEFAFHKSCLQKRPLGRRL